ncbi:uncharacterized protein LOC127565047 [Drosophila albomicans]|uniref:Uncharacterized protein LOC127565047 n=1 Tax=Drosophila albomicans TaxID=7291 RepID=A0A9C6T1J0_DROAB|nr:uncharacterized protein LOC127565047 [Drosophila albomicans]
MNKNLFLLFILLLVTACVLASSGSDSDSDSDSDSGSSNREYDGYYGGKHKHKKHKHNKPVYPNPYPQNPQYFQYPQYNIRNIRIRIPTTKDLTISSPIIRLALHTNNSHSHMCLLLHLDIRLVSHKLRCHRLQRIIPGSNRRWGLALLLDLILCRNSHQLLVLSITHLKSIRNTKKTLIIMWNQMLYKLLSLKNVNSF